MSALTPHIRVLRVQAERLESVAAVELNEVGRAVLSAMAKAKRAAADILEAEETKLEAAVRSGTTDPTYNPKGKLKP